MGGSLTVGTSAVVTHTLGEPIVNEHTAVVPTLAYYGKRSADAEAEADPYLLYGGYYGHAYGYGYPYAYGPYGYYGKRSADAEPAAADRYYGYYGLGYHGLGYRAYGGYYGHGLGYYGYGHVCTDTTVRCPSNSSQPKTSLEIASRTSEKWI